MGMRRLGLIASAVAFARSERGRRMIADARRKYDTPENRAKVSETIRDFGARSRGGAARSPR